MNGSPPGNGPVNLTRAPTSGASGGHAPASGYGEAAKKDVAKYAPINEHTVVKRAVAPTGYVADESETSAEPAKPEPAAEKDRRTKWREEQDAKRAKRDTDRTEQLSKRQGLAGVLLKKGDIAGAAKALGLSIPDFVALTNNAAMGVKPESEKPKELTPAEAFEAERKSFREEMQTFRNEQAAERNTRAMTSFIEDTLRPVLADKDAYELCHAAGIVDIETAAYQYMNQHYFDTSEKDEAGNITKAGEILDAKTVLDSFEKTLYDEQVATLERVKGIKKVAKYFAPAGDAGVADEAAPAKPDPAISNPNVARRVAAAMAEMAAEGTEAAVAVLGAPVAEVAAPAGDPAAPRVVRAPLGGNVRAVRTTGGRLSVQDRLAAARAATGR